ncbi:MAG: extracellular solute-binding protein [Fusobacteria bacterium]|nr:extracellular solute-binding protein [Fusobacteriota bacterium]
MKKKLLAILGSILLSTALLGVEVQLWEKWQTELDPTYDEIIASFEKTNPDIKIKRVHYEVEDLRYNFQNAAFSGNPPALVVGPADTVGVYATMGIIKPINEVEGFDKSILKDILEQGLEQLTIDGELYGIPEQIGNHLTLVYNKKFVKTVPETFEELMATDYGTEYKLVYNLNEPFWGIGFLAAYGGWIFDANNNPTLNTDSIKKGLDFMKKLKDTGTVPAECDYVIADTLFKDGKSAFIINGDWTFSDYAKVLGDNMGLARVPKVEGGDYYVPTTAVQGIFVAEGLDSDVEKAAAKFLAYITSKDVQLKITAKNKTLPVNKAAANDPAVTNDAFLAGSTAQMLVGKPMPVVPEMRAIWDALRPGQEDIMSGRATAAEAALNMQKIAEEKIAEMNQ